MKIVFLKAMACALLLGFVSCGNKNEDPAPPAEKKVGSVKVAYFFEPRGKMFDIADISFTYLDEAGKSKTEAMTGRTWSKTIEFKTFPAKTEFKASYKLKGALTEEAYNFEDSVNCVYTVYDTEGAFIEGKTLLNARLKIGGIPKADVEEFLTNEMASLSRTWKITKTPAGTGVVVEKID